MTGRLPNVAEAIFRLTRRGWASIQSALNAVENLWVKIGRAAQKILSRAHGRTVRRTAFYMLDGAPDSCSASSGKSVVRGAGPIIAKGSSLMSEQLDTSSELVEIQAQRQFQKELRDVHWSLSVSALDQRRAWPVTLLDRFDLDCLFGRAGLVGATRLSLVTRRLTDRTSASEVSKRSMPSRLRSFSVNLIVFLSVPVVGTSR